MWDLVASNGQTAYCTFDSDNSIYLSNIEGSLFKFMLDVVQLVTCVFVPRREEKTRVASSNMFVHSLF